MQRILIPLSALLLLSGLAAQEDPAPAVASALVVRTNSVDVADGVLQAFHSDAPLPALEEGSHVVLTMDDGGVLTSSVEQGAAKFLTIEARPAVLMDIFDAAVAQVRPMAGLAAMQLGQLGMSAADSQAVIEAVFDFPQQLERLKIVVANDPEETHELHATVDLVPSQGSWLGTLVGNLAPTGRGVADFGLGSAMARFRTDIALAKVRGSLEGIVRMFAGMGTEPGQLELAVRHVVDAFAACDGTSDTCFDPLRTGVRVVTGLTSPDAHRAMMTDEEYRGIMQRQRELAGAYAELRPNSAEHRGIAIHEIFTEYDDPRANPFAEDGKTTEYMATTPGFHLVASLGAGIGELQGMIDKALAEDLPRAPLPGGALATLDVRLGELFDFLAEVSNGMVHASGEMPDGLAVSAAKSGGGLTIKIDAQ